MKRRVFLGSVAAASAGLLAACGGGAGGSDEEIATDVDADTTAEISYGMWSEDQRPTIEQMIEAFNEEYPNIAVNITVTPWENYFTKLQTQAGGGDLPDVFWMNAGNFALYAVEGQLQSLADLDVDATKFPEALVETYTHDGTVYGYPKDYDTIGLFYNEALFEQAGVDVPTADWTWEDYHATAREISEALSDDGIYGAIGGWSNQELVYPMIYSYGGQIITEENISGYDSDPAKTAFQLMADMEADGSTPDVAFTAENWGAEVFGSARAAMMTGGNWNAGILKDMPAYDDIRVAPLPQGTQRATVIHGVGHVMSASSSHKDAAAALITFLAGEKAGQIQGESGGAIPAYEGLEAGYTDQYPTMDMQVFVDGATEDAFPMPASKNTQAWMDAEATWFPQIVGGDVTVAEGAEGLATDMNAVLQDEGE
ncbi:MAG: sugar ABC transporter substrate-binding protein [Brachybacterium sp.]|nr:sugar ABC transporter substrate-binding protein [Brachybacterium sp.]